MCEDGGRVVRQSEREPSLLSLSRLLKVVGAP